MLKDAKFALKRLLAAAICAVFMLETAAFAEDELKVHSNIDFSDTSMIGKMQAEGYYYAKSPWYYENMGAARWSSTTLADIEPAQKLEIIGGLGQREKSDNSLSLSYYGYTHKSGKSITQAVNYKTSVSSGIHTFEAEVYLGKDIRFKRIYLSYAYDGGTEKIPIELNDYATKFGDNEFIKLNGENLIAEENKWHTAAVTSDLNNGKAAFYLDGNLVKEYSLGQKFTELKTVTFQTQTDEGYGSITSNFAADNIVIYAGGYMGASTVTADSADIIVDNSSNTISVPEGTTGSRLKSALAAVSENYGISVSSDGTLTGGDSVTVFCRKNSKLRRVYRISAKTNIIVSENFEENSVLEKYTDINMYYPKDNTTGTGWDFYNNGKSLTSSTNTDVIEKTQVLAEMSGIGGRSDKSLALVVTDYKSVSGGANSPYFQLYTPAAAGKSRFTSSFDFYLSGNANKCSVGFVYKKSDGSEFPVNFTVSSIKSTFGNAQIKESGGPLITRGDWHTIAADTDISAKTVTLYVDSKAVSTYKFADNVSIGGLSRIKFAPEYNLYEVGKNENYSHTDIANGVTAADNIIIYDGAYSLNSALTSATKEIAADSGKNIITVAEGMSGEYVASKLSASENFSVSVSTNGTLTENDTVKSVYTDNEKIFRVYNIKFAPQKYLANYDFNDALTEHKYLLASNKNGEKYNFLTGEWTFFDSTSDTARSFANAGIGAAQNVKPIGGLGGKSFDDRALAVVFDNYTKSSQSEKAAAVNFKNDELQDYDGIITAEFELYFSKAHGLYEVVFDRYDSVKASHFCETILKLTENGAEFMGAEIDIGSAYKNEKWTKTAICLEQSTGKYTLYIDGKMIGEQISGKTGSGVYAIEFKDCPENANGLSTVSAVDNVRIYTGGALPALKLNSNSEKITVADGAKKIVAARGESVSKENLNCENGADIKIDGNTLTVSNNLFSEEYEIVTAESSAIFTSDGYIKDVNNADELTYKANAAYIGSGGGALMITAAYDGGELVKTNMKKYDGLRRGDEFFCDINLPYDFDGSVKTFIFDGYSGISPLCGALTREYNPTVDIYMAGDSLMQTYTDESYPLEGWGTYFAQCTNENAVVHNAAQSGATTRTFLNDYFDGRILNKLAANDIVIVSLCHNDEGTVTDGIYTDENPLKITPERYKANLNEFAEKIKNAGAEVVFVTGPNTGRSLYCHTYPEYMKEVAKSQNAMCFDLYEAHNGYLSDGKTVPKDNTAEVSYEHKTEMFLYAVAESPNPDTGKPWITQNERFNSARGLVRQYNADLTHFNEYGAYLISQFVSRGFKQNGIIADLLK